MQRPRTHGPGFRLRLDPQGRRGNLGHLTDDTSQYSYTHTSRTDVIRLWAEYVLGAVNHLPEAACALRLVEARPRALAHALEALLPRPLTCERATMIARASTCRRWR
jgi:hypothetical protein